ncbi:MAG: porin family protein [Cyclobacteriaceae bacterium]
MNAERQSSVLLSWKRIVALAIIGIGVFISSSQAVAQDRWSIELRPGVHYATQNLGDADIDLGFGFDVLLKYRFAEYMSIYGGWGWNMFSSKDSFAGTSGNFEETGYTYGLQFLYPLKDSRTSILARAGALHDHIEVENDEGDIIADSGHGFGWQLEAGLAFALGERWTVLPSVRYHYLSREISLNSVKVDADLSYVSLGVGFARVF